MGGGPARPRRAPHRLRAARDLPALPEVPDLPEGTARPGRDKPGAPAYSGGQSEKLPDERNAMSTVHLNLDSFEEAVNKPGILLLDFWAEWCGPCKMFAPVFEAASERHQDVVFAKVDTEAEQDLAAAVGISAIPTIMVFRDGVLLFRESGALPAQALDSIVEQAKKLDMEEVKKKVAEHAHEHGPGCDHDHDHDHDHGEKA
jgi:thioredoxin